MVSLVMPMARVLRLTVLLVILMVRVTGGGGVGGVCGGVVAGDAMNNGAAGNSDGGVWLRPGGVAGVVDGEGVVGEG